MSTTIHPSLLQDLRLTVSSLGRRAWGKGRWILVCIQEGMPVGRCLCRWIQLQLGVTVVSVFSQAGYSSVFFIAVRKHSEEGDPWKEGFI